MKLKKQLSASYDDTILYDFQKKLVDQAKPNFIYAADVGTGKSLMALHHYLKHSNGEPLLIIAPASKRDEGGWTREVEFVNEQYGTDIEHEVISYYKLSKDYLDYRDWFVIFDEAHMIKNSTSNRGKAGFQLSKIASQFTLLTATPLPNSWEDSINYFKMFGFTKNKTQFNRQFAITEPRNFGGRTFNQVVDYRHKETLEEAWSKISLSIKKDDALDLPPITFETVNFKKSREHNIIEKNRVFEDVAYDSSPKLMSGLRYYASWKEKLKYTKMFLEGTSNNVVIFYQFTKEFDDLLKVAKELKKTIYAVNGKHMKLPHKRDWDDVTNSVTLIQYQAGSSGIELQYANEVIYYTPTYSFSDYQQSLGRTHRNGQTNKVTVYQYKTKGTVETEVWHALDNKQDFDERIYQITKLGSD